MSIPFLKYVDVGFGPNRISGFAGDAWFVDSGTDDSSGRTPETSLGTIAEAQTVVAAAVTDGSSSANHGDVIVCMPGHADTVSSVGAITMATAGVTVLGIGEGSAQPTITLDTANTATVALTAAGITFENIHFIANFLDIATAITLVGAADATFRNCRFSETSVILNAAIWINEEAAATSPRLTVENCNANAYGTANTHFVNFAGTGDGHIVRRNVLMGDWATMCVGGAGVITNALIDDNRILNVVATADTCINVAATATGLISNNRCAGGHATDGIVCGDMGSLENYYVDHDTDLSGVIEPAII
jgi:hypothetical protein